MPRNAKLERNRPSEGFQDSANSSSPSRLQLVTRTSSMRKIRNPKLEIRNNIESRMTETIIPRFDHFFFRSTEFVSNFGIRISDLHFTSSSQSPRPQPARRC